MEFSDMPKTIQSSHADRMREQVEWLAAGYDASVPKAFAHAMKSFLTALDYKDVALMRSHLNTALEAFREVTHEAIQKRLGRPQRFKDLWKQMWDQLANCPTENGDELGQDITRALDADLDALIELRDGSVKMLQQKGFNI